MDKKNMRKVLLEGLLFLIYAALCYEVADLAQWGGLRKHLILFAILAGIFIFCWIRWFVLKKKEGGEKTSKKWLVGKVFAYLLVTVFFAVQVVHSAIPFNGALSWKIDEWRNHKEVALEKDNFYDYGIEGVLEALDERFSLPDPLYLSGDFTLRFDPTGKILRLEAFLYGKGEKDEVKSYLLSYDSEKKEGALEVYLNGEVNATFEKQHLLSPMRSLLGSSAVRDAPHPQDSPSDLTYSYDQVFFSGQDVRFIPGDADGDGTLGDPLAMRKLSQGGYVTGYALRLNDSKYFLMEPVYHSDAERQEQLVEETAQTEGWVTDRNTGSLYYYLKENPQMAYKLEVADAALGSYYYQLFFSEDRGETWTLLNEDPFNQRTGVAKGLVFFTKDLGFIGIGGASGDSSQVFVTRDGGKSFEEVVLPKEEVKDLPEGYSLKDYGYVSMPEKEGDTLKICLKLDEQETDGISFVSEDEGKTWKVAQ